jgi:hypothetical protein
MNTVRSFPDKIHWLTIAEFWNNITWSQNVPFGFRITLGLGKPVASESDLFLFSTDRIASFLKTAARNIPRSGRKSIRM